MKLSALFVSGILIFLLTLPAQAENRPADPGQKLGRGLANAALGWTEIPRRQEKAMDERGLIGGIFWGTFDGLGNTVKRTGAGVYEALTFFNVPKTADPIVEPEFPIQGDRAGYRPKDYTF